MRPGVFRKCAQTMISIFLGALAALLTQKFLSVLVQNCLLRHLQLLSTMRIILLHLLLFPLNLAHDKFCYSVACKGQAASMQTT